MSKKTKVDEVAINEETTQTNELVILPTEQAELLKMKAEIKTAVDYGILTQEQADTMDMKLYVNFMRKTILQQIEQKKGEILNGVYAVLHDMTCNDVIQADAVSAYMKENNITSIILSPNEDGLLSLKVGLRPKSENNKGTSGEKSGKYSFVCGNITYSSLKKLSEGIIAPENLSKSGENGTGICNRIKKYAKDTALSINVIDTETNESEKFDVWASGKYGVNFH